MIFILSSKDKAANFGHDERRWSPLHRRHVKVLLPSFRLAAVEGGAAGLLPMMLIEGGCFGFRSVCCRPGFWLLLLDVGDDAGEIKQCLAIISPLTIRWIQLEKS
jgi:hypothetical protein